MSADQPKSWWRMPLATVVVGVLSGVSAGLLALLLHAIQHIAFGYDDATFLVGVEQSSGLRGVSHSPSVVSSSAPAGGCIAGGTGPRTCL